ncbi:MAG: uracil-xanthine permease family protein [Gemmatimonadota bacterium]
MGVVGLQHMFVMFGATVLVPLLTGLDVAVALFASGLGTLVFHVATRMRVPVYLGSSFAFIPPILAVAETGTLAQATAGILVAGLVYVGVSFALRLVSIEAIQRLIPPHVTGPIIILIGLMLAPVAVENAAGGGNEPMLERIGTLGAWALAAVTLGTGVFVRVFLPRRGYRYLATLPVLFGLAAGYAAAALAGVVEWRPVADAPWLGVPDFMAPRFDLRALGVVVPVALVTMIEHLGDVLAIGEVVEEDFIEDPGLHRTLLGDGLATVLAGLVGAPANTTYSENTGTVALTGIRDPAVMRVAAAGALLLSFVPKFAALVASIPLPVVGGISILLFGMIAGIGIKSLVDHRVDLGDPRVLIVVSTMLVLGLGEARVDVGPTELSGLALAAVVGILGNLVLAPRRESTKP